MLDPPGHSVDKTLTLMEPGSDRSFNSDVQAWGRLFYSENNGEFKGWLEITPPRKAAVAAKPVKVRAEEPDLWSELEPIIWGSQDGLDRAEAAAYREGGEQRKRKASLEPGPYPQRLLPPYPFTLEICAVEQIAFYWDEYTAKRWASRMSVWVTLAWQQPPLPTKGAETAAGGDAVMAEASTTPQPSQAAQSSQAKASNPTAKQGAMAKKRERFL